VKLFVAGGTGVLGTCLRELVAAGHHVRSTARGTDKAERVRRIGAEPVEVDVYDVGALREVVRGCDAALRLTTKIPPLARMRRMSAWAQTLRLRTEGQRALINACLAEGVQRVVSESITFVYADAGDRVIDETSPIDDSSGIMRATLEGEGEMDRVRSAGGAGVVLRLAAFYGHDVPSTLDFIRMARRRMLPQIGGGRNYYSSIFVPDAARAVVAALTVPGGTYNVCDDDPVRFAEYLQLLAEAVGAPRPLRLPGFLGPMLFGAAWRYASRSQRVSNAKFKAVAGWRPAVPSVREGFALVARELSAH
jgi:nucleoside-diphosphate-sugar epimerase